VAADKDTSTFVRALGPVGHNVDWIAPEEAALALVAQLQQRHPSASKLRT